MTNTAKALHNFFSSFEIPAFVEGDIPDKIPDGNDNMVPGRTYFLVRESEL